MAGEIGSVEWMLTEGNRENPFKAPAPVDTRTFQQYDKSNPIAQRQLGSSSIGAILPNNPYRQEALKSIEQNVADGLSGMAMGYTKNGIPHNDPRVVKAYIENIRKRLGNSDINMGISSLVPEANSTLANLTFRRDGQEIGNAVRKFTPKGVETVMIESKLPKGQSMGVIPEMYPAEAQFQRVYGGELGGHFVNPNTSKGFQISNPEAKVIPMTDGKTGTWYEDFIKAKYKGLMDFPVD